MKYTIETDDYYHARNLMVIANYLESGDGVPETIAAIADAIGDLGPRTDYEKFPNQKQSMDDEFEFTDFPKLDRDIHLIRNVLERLQKRMYEYQEDEYMAAHSKDYEAD
jgi:hypothetical protein